MLDRRGLKAGVNSLQFGLIWDNLGLRAESL